MKLYILRHAKPAVGSLLMSDIDRPLIQKGYDQCELVREQLSPLLKDHTQIYCSPSKRTWQTAAHILSPELLKKVIIDDSLYLANLTTLLRFIWKCGHTGDLLLIGHNNGISELVNYFSDEKEEILSTCHLIGLEFDIQSWEEASRGMAKIFLNYRPQVS